MGTDPALTPYQLYMRVPTLHHPHLVLYHPILPYPTLPLFSTQVLQTNASDGDFQILDEAPPPAVHPFGTLVTLRDMTDKRFNKKHGTVNDPLGSENVPKGMVGLKLLAKVAGVTCITVLASKTRMVQSKRSESTEAPVNETAEHCDVMMSSRTHFDMHSALRSHGIVLKHTAQRA